MELLSGTVISVCLFIASIFMIFVGILLLLHKSASKKKSQNTDKKLIFKVKIEAKPVEITEWVVTYLVSVKILTAGEGFLNNISLYIASVDPVSNKNMVLDEKKLQIPDIFGEKFQDISVKMRIPVKRTVLFRGKLIADGIEPVIVNTEKLTAGGE